MPTKPTLLRLVAALASGGVLVWVAPPVNLHWIHWFSFLPLFWALRPGDLKKNLLMGYAAGWLAQFLIFFWLVETIIIFSNIPWILAFLIHVVFATAFAVPYGAIFGLAQWLRERLGTWWVLALPTLGVAVEQVSPQLFPYYQGVSQYRVPWTWQLASVTGVMGVSFLVLSTNAVLAEVMYRRQERRPLPNGPLVTVAAVFALNLGYGAWRHARVELALEAAPTARIALMQQNTTMEIRLQESALASLESWMKVTREAAPEHPDLVIWPEGSVPFNPHDERPVRALGKRSARQFFEELTRNGDFDLLIGGGTIEHGEGQSYTAYNSVYLFTRDGQLSDRYDKIVPLPFGEYIPFASTFPWLKELIQGPGDFRAGTRPTVFQGTTKAGGTYTYTVPICYEAILQGLMRDLLAAEDPGPPGPPFQSEGFEGPVDLFVNITNDAWFGDTNSPHQHAMLAAVQATELGRPLVRDAYTGISFVVEPHGDILHETRPFSDSVQVVDVRLGRFDTLYARGGWMFSWLCVLGAAASFLVGWRRRPA